jgi:two-component system chemotaxis sensor kinase CheA
VRVRTDALDRILSSVGEVILSASQLRGATGGARVAAPASLSGGLDRMERVVGELQRRALELRTTPLLRVMEQLPRVARELAQRLGKRVEVELAGAELELDRSILDRLGDPLVHLIRNAVDHGIEATEARRRAGKPAAGRIAIEARRDRDTIRVAVRDDGAGIDLDAVRERAVAAGLVLGDLAEDLPPEEIAALVFRPGLSTANAVSEVSGRGVGMDAVKATIESLGGRVELESRRGLGTVTTLVVPITAAIQRVLLLGLAGETVAVSIAKVERIVEVAASAIEHGERESFALVDGEPVLVIDLVERLGLPGSAPRASVPLVLCEVRDARVALRVEELQGQQEIYVKPVPELLAGLRGLAGLTVLGDGRPVFLLDLNHLV